MTKREKCGKIFLYTRYELPRGGKDNKMAEYKPENIDGGYVIYKGKPLVRQGQFIYYGFPTDKVILFMNILETEKNGDMDVASKVSVQIQLTDDSVS